MTISLSWRKFALLTHILSSVAWIGAAAVYIAMAVVVATSADALSVRGALVTMQVSVWSAIVPLGVASLLTGLLISLGTKWGLFQHYWVIFKLALNLFGLTILLIYTQSIDYFADMATQTTGQDSLAELQSPTHI